MAQRQVVITGIGVICAAGRDCDEFWQSLTSATGAITPVRDERFSAFDARHAGQIPDEWITEQLPATDHGLDRTAQLALVAAYQACTSAGISESAPDADRYGLVIGKCQATPDGDGGNQPMHLTGDILADRLTMRGPRIVVSTACAAGGNAVGLAKDKILTGEADVVLAGGVDPLLFGTYAGFAGLQALSIGPCAPYSRSDGLNLGEGAAFVVVEPLDRALARGAVPLAEVAGYGLSADAYHATAPDPTGRGGITAVRRALADAGLSTSDVDYVSGHGTGTPANDSMERKVMRTVFGERAGEVPTSSTKSFVGHTLGAAGAVEAVASVLALRSDVAPPTIGFPADSEPTDLDFVPNAARPMRIDTVVSNNYAFGGNNVSLALRTPREPVADGGDGLAETEVVITGLGPVCGIGVGIDEVAAAVAAGQVSTAPPELTGRSYAPRSLWRHMNTLSRMAIAASRLAIEDAALTLRAAERENVGVMFATSAGSEESTAGFDESVLADPRSPAVLNFSNVVLNATGGAVCQTLGLRGPTTTICTGAASTSIALDCAVETIRAGKATTVIVVAADDVTGPGDASATVPYDVGAGPAARAPAAVALVVESAAQCAERGGRPYARIARSRHVGAGADDDRATITRSLITGGGAIDVVIGAATGGEGDGAEASAVLAALPNSLLTTTSGYTGDCGSATGALNLALGSLAIRDALIPAIPGLHSPVAGSLDRYVTKPDILTGVTRTAVLSMAPGSVRGMTLLERV